MTVGLTIEVVTRAGLDEQSSVNPSGLINRQSSIV